jgi:hypothetical protein
LIPIVYPRTINWFYSTQAKAMAEDLTASGIPARAVASDRPGELDECGSEIALLVCFAEALVAAKAQNRSERLLEALDRIDRRVLVNFDSLHSHWFGRHLEDRPDYFSDVFDYGLYRQTVQPSVRGMTYHFVPESLSRAEQATIVPWHPGRPLPWTMLGHATRDRSALIEAILQCLPKNGFVFSPPLRPFTERSGLNRAAITRVLRQTDFYIWGSHHLYPYHETQRALHAVTAGAIPAKIDPLHSHRVRLPWVYPSLEALLRDRDKHGLEQLYAKARGYIEGQGWLGDNLRDALARMGVAPSRSGKAEGEAA